MGVVTNSHTGLQPFMVVELMSKRLGARELSCGLSSGMSKPQCLYQAMRSVLLSLSALSVT
jgi:hypothetical protein